MVNPEDYRPISVPSVLDTITYKLIVIKDLIKVITTINNLKHRIDININIEAINTKSITRNIKHTMYVKTTVYLIA